MPPKKWVEMWKDYCSLCDVKHTGETYEHHVQTDEDHVKAIEVLADEFKSRLELLEWIADKHQGDSGSRYEDIYSDLEILYKFAYNAGWEDGVLRGLQGEINVGEI